MMHNFIKKINLFIKKDRVFHAKIPKDLDREIEETLRQLNVPESEIKSIITTRSKLIDREDT